MQPQQKNWVFLATMLFVALFSVVIVFANVRYQGRSLSRASTVSNIEELMGEIEDVNQRLKSTLRNSGPSRHEVYAEASRIASLLEELVKETPENPTPDRIGNWDHDTSKSVAAAHRLADIAGDPTTDWTLAGPAYGNLQKTCVDCHNQFPKK